MSSSKITLDENLESIVDDFEDINSDDILPITKEEELFAEDIYKLIQSIIDNEKRVVEEEFTSENNLENHYR